MSEPVSRRKYLQAAGGTVAGLVIGGIGGYLAGQAATPAAPPGGVVTQTVTAPGPTKGLGGYKPKIAMLMIGPIDDLGWHTQHYKGLMHLQDLGYEVHNTESVAPDQVEKVARDYVALGYNLIYYTGGWALEGYDAMRAAFPDVGHVLVEGTEANQGPNAETCMDQSHQLGYVEGMIAGQLTKSKVVGWLLGMEVPDELLWTAGGYWGLKAADPKIKELYSIIGASEDPAKGKESAVAVMDAGADVIVECGDGTSYGIVEAVKSKDLPLLSYWGGSPTYSGSKGEKLYPDHQIAEGFCDWGPAYELAAKRFEEGKFGWRGYEPSFFNDQLKLVLNPKFEAQFGAMADDLIARIKDRTLAVPSAIPKA
jgi:basic membrane protein A